MYENWQRTSHTLKYSKNLKTKTGAKIREGNETFVVRKLFQFARTFSTKFRQTSLLVSNCRPLGGLTAERRGTPVLKLVSTC